MNAVLVGPDLEENLSIAYLSSALHAAGHGCSLLTFDHEDDVPRVVRAVLRERPPLVGLSMVAQRRYGEYQRLIGALRTTGYGGHVTAGGHFASLRAAEILRDTRGLDSILHHDGEVRIVQLMDIVASGGELPGSLDGVTWRGTDGTIAHRVPLHVAAVDSFPFPSRRKPDKTLGYAKAPIVSSRGCSGSCSFCSIHAWHKQVPHGRLRFRSGSSVADEMIELHRSAGVRVFVFHDDNFIHPDARTALRRCQSILERAEEGIGEPFAFVIKCRPDDVREDLFRYLREKGLVRAYVGIETNSRLGLSVLNRHVAPAVNESALSVLEALGIYACYNLLIFHPESTLEEFQENLQFLRQHSRQPFDVARTELYAFSALEQQMVEAGRAVGDYRGFDYRIGDSRAELAFELFADLLRERHFADRSIVRRAQDLGFRLNLLRRLQPAMVPADLADRVGGFIRDVNSGTIGCLAEIARLAGGEPKELTAVLAELRDDVNIRIKRETVQWASLSLELEGRAFLGRCGVSPRAIHTALPHAAARAATAIPFVGMIMGGLSCLLDSTVVCDPPPPPASYARDIASVFQYSCATAGCHSGKDRASGLVLEKDSSYASIVGVPSEELPAMKRIKGGDPSGSYLLRKLQGTQASVGGSGEQMPKGRPPDPLLIADVEAWVRRGAPND